MPSSFHKFHRFSFEVLCFYPSKATMWSDFRLVIRHLFIIVQELAYEIYIDHYELITCMTYRDHPLPHPVPLHPRSQQLLQHQGSGAPVDQQIYCIIPKLEFQQTLDSQRIQTTFFQLSVPEAEVTYLSKSGWVELSVMAWTTADSSFLGGIWWLSDLTDCSTCLLFSKFPISTCFDPCHCTTYWVHNDTLPRALKSWNEKLLPIKWLTFKGKAEDTRNSQP